MVWLSLLGCTQPASDYRLAIVPKLLDDQRDDVLAAQPDVKLLVRPPDADLEVWYLGVASSGSTLTLEGRPPLPAGTSLGLIFEAPSAVPETWHRSATLAYGGASIDQALNVGEDQVELPILAPRVDTFSRFAKLADADRKLCGAIAALPDGRAFVFGGGDPDDPDVVAQVPVVSSDTILEIDPTDDGWSDPKPVGTMPELDWTSPGDPDQHSGARSCASAAAVETADGPRIFVFGGRYTYDYSSYNTSNWFEWDPDAEAVVDLGEIEVSRSSALVVPVGAGKLLVYGGLVGVNIPFTPSYELFDTGTHKVDFGEHATELGEGVYGAFATTLDGDAVVCTGAAWDGSHTFTPLDRCVRIDGQDHLTTLAPLPEPVFGGSIAPLPDGGLLVTGGTAEAFQGNLASPQATDRAFRWDPARDQWRAVAPMVHARGFHRSFLAPDGRVVIVGGSTQVPALFGTTGPAVRCTEVYDPERDEFTATTCNDASSGAEPGLAVSTAAAFVLQGVEFSLGTEGGGSIGAAGVIPEL